MSQGVETHYKTCSQVVVPRYTEFVSLKKLWWSGTTRSLALSRNCDKVHKKKAMTWCQVFATFWQVKHNWGSWTILTDLKNMYKNKKYVPHIWKICTFRGPGWTLEVVEWLETAVILKKMEAQFATAQILFQHIGTMTHKTTHKRHRKGPVSCVKQPSSLSSSSKPPSPSKPFLAIILFEKLLFSTRPRIQLNTWDRWSSTMVWRNLEVWPLRSRYIMSYSPLHPSFHWTRAAHRHQCRSRRANQNEQVMTSQARQAAICSWLSVLCIESTVAQSRSCRLVWCTAA